MSHRIWLIVCLAALAWSGRGEVALAREPQGMVPPALHGAIMLTDADASATKGAGMPLPSPAVGSLQHPVVRLWDEVRPLPPNTAGSGTVTVTTGR